MLRIGSAYPSRAARRASLPCDRVAGDAKANRILVAVSGGDEGVLRQSVQKLRSVVHCNEVVALQLLTGTSLFSGLVRYQTHLRALSEAQCVEFLRLLIVPESERTWAHLVNAGIVTGPPDENDPVEAFNALRSDRCLREWLVEGTIDAHRVGALQFKVVDRRLPRGPESTIAVLNVRHEKRRQLREEQLARVSVHAEGKSAGSRVAQWLKGVWRWITGCFGRPRQNR